MQQLPFIDYKKPVGNHSNCNFIKHCLHSLQAKLYDRHVPTAGMRVKLKMLLAEL